MRSLPLALCALGLAAMPAPSSAQTPGPPQNRREFFEKLVHLDANGNQAIEPEEVPEAARPAFDRILEQIDANKNGKLEIDELRAMGEKLREGANPAEAEQRFKAMDADQDGKVSATEFKGPEAAFGRLDANSDGFIDSAEAEKAFRAMVAGRARERVAGMDANKDGKVTREEFQGPAPLFDRLDSNRDGAITPDDRPESPEAPGARTPNAPRPERGDSTSIPLSAVGRRFMALDSDGDGKVSRQEIQGPASEYFDRVDTDHDGGISREELRAAGEKLRERLGRPAPGEPATKKSDERS